MRLSHSLQVFNFFGDFAQPEKHIERERGFEEMKEERKLILEKKMTECDCITQPSTKRERTELSQLKNEIGLEQLKISTPELHSLTLDRRHLL